jgi:hypothetical protein
VVEVIFQNIFYEKNFIFNFLKLFLILAHQNDLKISKILI